MNSVLIWSVLFVDTSLLYVNRSLEALKLRYVDESVVLHPPTKNIVGETTGNRSRGQKRGG